jgi:hypothetical protein
MWLGQGEQPRNSGQKRFEASALTESHKSKSPAVREGTNRGAKFLFGGCEEVRLRPACHSRPSTDLRIVCHNNPLMVSKISNCSIKINVPIRRYSVG